ncbi:glycosyltransferase [Brunnivagina elsteri]|uniref:Beta-monoglucosyldiacylglycerol synthase n=1 Tax=Brunnivagina elsteri CCALA 953 TaxID=987040 RepID=A0A2A2TL18_9CYAN|nr:glycosyltransferase [Calothrix elsteri]PAX57158.1 glycosyl transferase [Calothrix elsteri CCALA 953]
MRDKPTVHLRDRRFQSTLVVLLVWVIISLLQWFQMHWLVVWLAGVLALQSLRMLLAKARNFGILENGDLPKVSVLVPAKNESAVLSSLVANLFALDYSFPLDIWIIDDGSTDTTPEILEQLQNQFPRLQVHQRLSKGGKSGALNAVLPFIEGEIILICDADAQLSEDFLRKTIPLFNRENTRKNIGAVQAGKTISNRDSNFLTQCQQMEMNCDRILQTQRIAAGGMAELRGNGMLVRRDLLAEFHGWNEDTLTDDLDLTFQLYLASTEIAFVTTTEVKEEGVKTWKELWYQRCRWAEGGFQRYLDYFPQIYTLGWVKEIDLILFFLLQFLLPIGLIPDLLWTIFYSHKSVLFPLQSLLGLILTVAFMSGIYQFQNLRGTRLIWATIQGSFYMLHWIPVMIFSIYKLCIQRQKLHWHKSEHSGVRS